MEFVCTSKHLNAAYFTALDVTGREHLVVVAKASWQIPMSGQRPRPIAPLPLYDADGYFGAPGESAMRYGDDFARFKPRCDVLFDACAHAPDGKPVKTLDVSVQVGPLKKKIRVVGNRHWRKTLTGLAPSTPEPFVSMPLHFGRAFGGSRTYEKKGQKLSETLLRNPAGIGWAGKETRSSVDGQPVANLELPLKPIQRPDDEHEPVALSAIGKHWSPRSHYTGTFDELWKREVAPFLPEDFDDQYHQCAPQDQQIPYLQGGEAVHLERLLHDQPYTNFRLPPLDHMKVRVLRKDYTTETLSAPADTLFFETESRRFSVTWRVCTPIQRRIQEFDVVAVGSISPEWWSMRTIGLDMAGDCYGCAEEAEAA